LPAAPLIPMISLRALDIAVYPPVSSPVKRQGSGCSVTYMRKGQAPATAFHGFGCAF